MASMHVDVVVFKEVLFDSGCVGSGIEELIIHTTWLLLDAECHRRNAELSSVH